MRNLAVFFCLPASGCVCLNPAHKKPVAPSVSTTSVISTLTDTKTDLAAAGESNTNVGRQIDKALSLAEKLDLLLRQLDESSNKNAIKPL